ncbi:MAG: YunC family protein [Planctomycetia bacterium]|nr:YunC family protein [Planctomycetia bacterium]
MTLPLAINRTLEFRGGQAIGTSYQWPGGQYCAIHTSKGLVGCGIYDIRAANEFSLAVAIARGTPAKPLRDPEDLFNAKILEVSQAAEKLGISPGMTGKEAVEKMLAAK